MIWQKTNQSWLKKLGMEIVEKVLIKKYLPENIRESKNKISKS